MVQRTVQEELDRLQISGPVCLETGWLVRNHDDNTYLKLGRSGTWVKDRNNATRFSRSSDAIAAARPYELLQTWVGVQHHGWIKSEEAPPPEPLLYWES